jgi:glycosyltransferase involved in cell wall biosynthesis
MRYSIITPSLGRDTLLRLCQSIDQQSCADWEHIVMIDSADAEHLLYSIRHPQRTVVHCSNTYRDWGNTCRREAWDLSSGEYLLYIDDDNYYADMEVLETLLSATQPVVLFPLLHRGSIELPIPIRVGRSDSNALMVKREIGQWPAGGGHETDGIFIQQLTSNHSYELLTNRALVVYEYGARTRRRVLQQ